VSQSLRSVAQAALGGAELRGFRQRAKMGQGEKKRVALEFYLIATTPGAKVEDLFSYGVLARCRVGMAWESRKKNALSPDAALEAAVGPVKKWLTDEMQLLCLGTGTASGEEILRVIEAHQNDDRLRLRPRG